MSDLLATIQDAARYGKTDITEESLLIASNRVREYTGQNISSGRYTMMARRANFATSQRPLQKVHRVVREDGHPVDFTVRPGSIVNVDTVETVTIDYTAGYDPVPESIVELVVSVADRLDNIPAAVSLGVSSEQAGAESQSYGFDAYKSVSGLSAGEAERLDRLFPKRAFNVGR